jgi:DNA replication protein DnaC
MATYVYMFPDESGFQTRLTIPMFASSSRLGPIDKWFEESDEWRLVGWQYRPQGKALLALVRPGDTIIALDWTDVFQGARAQDLFIDFRDHRINLLIIKFNGDVFREPFEHYEQIARNDEGLVRLMNHARLRQNGAVEDNDARIANHCDRDHFQLLTKCAWIHASQHLLISGPRSAGKSWLACNLGRRASREGFTALYWRAPQLLAELAAARSEGRLVPLVTSLGSTRLLIIDDWDPEPQYAQQRQGLLEIVDDRKEKGSLLITSQIPMARWHEIIGDSTSEHAILDRIICRAHCIELEQQAWGRRPPLAAGKSLTNENET